MDIATLERWLATGFGLGHFKPGAGTMASLAALLLALPLQAAGGTLALGLAAALAFIVGNGVAGAYAKRTSQLDPPEVVIDELAGQWLVLAAVPFDATGAALGFALFRLFDILKPWPISWFDAHIHGGIGIMLDDFLAALAAIACYWTIDVLLIP